MTKDTSASRQVLKLIHIVLSVLLVLGSPYILLGYAFGAAAGANMISMGKVQEGIGMLFLATFLFYFVFFNLYGWFALSKHEPFGVKHFVYPFVAWICIVLLQLFSFF